MTTKNPMNHRKLPRHHTAAEIAKRHGNSVVVSKPGTADLKAMVPGISRKVVTLPAEKIGDTTVGPFNLVHLYVNGHWVGTRETVESDLNPTRIAEYVKLGDKTYFVLVGQCMEVTDKGTFPTIDASELIAWQVRGLLHQLEGWFDTAKDAPAD